jgi:hypothetical protein
MHSPSPIAGAVRAKPRAAAASVGRAAGNLIAWRRALLAFGPPIPSTRLVLLVIAHHMNGHGTRAFPSLSTIAKECAMSRRTIATHVRHAVESGWLNRHHWRHRLGTGLARNRYVAAYPPSFDEKLLTRPSANRHPGEEPLF